MMDLMLKLTRLEQPNPVSLLLLSSAPPLLPSPMIMVTTQPQSYIGTGLSMHVVSPPLARLPKLEVPPFSGEGVLPWIFQIERFFIFHQVLPDQKIDIAVFYMTGEVLQWYHWLYSTQQLSLWDAFARQAELRWVPPLSSTMKPSSSKWSNEQQ